VSVGISVGEWPLYFALLIPNLIFPPSPPSLWRYLLSWPGVKGVARRKHRPGEPFSARLRPASAGYGGPIARPPVAPTRNANRRGDPRPVGPTGPENGSCLLVSAGNALDPGPEKAAKTLTFIRVDKTKMKAAKVHSSLTSAPFLGYVKDI